MLTFIINLVKIIFVYGAGAKQNNPAWRLDPFALRGWSYGGGRVPFLVFLEPAAAAAA
jgi:hypothetical protein